MEVKMNKTRLPIIIVAVSLVFSTVFALWAYQGSIGADESSRSYAGMGDLQRLDAQYSNASGGVAKNNRPYAGMGDVHRFEAQPPAPKSGADNSPSPSHTNTVGMGDLRLFEAKQIIGNTSASGSRSPGRLCPNLSTSGGESDAGVSAPVYVLQEMGCR
jgi:hypothetical protein